MAAAQHGDRRALEHLLSRHYDRFHRLCRRLCGNDADADDATQEALMAIVRGLASYDGRAAFSTWSHRVTTNACLDELRRRGRRPRPAEEPELLPGPRIAAGASEGDVGEGVAQRMDVDQALLQLPLDLRAVVVLRDVTGHDYATIAAILDIPIGTVRSRISRGRARLVDLLEVGNPSPTRQRPRT